MVLKTVHDKIDEIPEQFRELYTEKSGKWEITGIDGVKTPEDVRRVQESLTKERNDHKTTKAALTAWGELKPDEVTAKLSRIEELETAVKGKIDDAKLDEMANKRAEAIVKTKLSPVERELAQIRAQAKEKDEKLSAYETRERQRTVHEKVGKAFLTSKGLPEALDDALMQAERVMEVTEDGRVVTKDGVGVTPGLEAAAWLAEMQPKKPHWWPGNQGGGARGSGTGTVGFGTQNPWSHEHWNMTKQGAYVKEHGQDKAGQMAKAAGTTLGGARPAPKK